MLTRRDFHRRVAASAASVVGLSALSGCGDKGGAEKDKAGGKDGGKTLTLYTWADYTPLDMVKEFEKAHGCSVKLLTFENNEDLLKKLREKQEIYDVVVPSDYMVGRLAAEGLLAELDRAALPGFKNLDPKFIGPYYDKENKFSVPYSTQMTGIGFLKSRMTDGIPDSWGVLFSGKFKNRLEMLDDVRECFAAALKFLGHDKGGWSVNSADAGQLKEAFELLKKQKPGVAAYESSKFDQDLAEGKAFVVHGYAGQIAKRMDSNPDIGFVIPKEGTVRSVDNLCIPKNARHPALAAAFLNASLEPKFGAALTNLTGYQSVVAGAGPLVDEKRRKNPAIFPDEATQARGEMIRDLAPDVRKLYDGYWERIKGG
jgi:spermidine/putrescine transport system substrate-binding protein